MASIGNTGAASDTCSDVTWTNDYTALSDDCGATGSALVTFTATDDCGNASTTQATFTIEDTTDPVLAGVPGDETVECSEVPDPASPTASDNCDADVDIAFVEERIDGDCPNNYTLARTWTATDDCGNESVETQVITVQDTTPPIINCPVDVFISCTDDYLPSSTGFATGSDNCGDVTITYTDALPDEGRQNCEEFIRTWTATDACGNEASCDQKITTKIDLSIIKTFNPTEVPQGTLQTFTIVVSNAGPSDAVDVSVTDVVDPILEVTSISLPMMSIGDCTDSAGNNIDCTLQIPAGGSETITVEYLTAPFFDGGVSPYGTGFGDDFYFVFLNGYILEGSTDNGPVKLTYPNGTQVDITNDVTIVTSLTRNDIIFDPPGDDPAFELHLSCSDPFTDGWGQSGGPVQGVDNNWQIAFFTIARYNPQGFLKSCGNVVNNFDVPNTATAMGDDSFGTQTVSDDATVQSTDCRPMVSD
ncbi:hypothetical protein [uncultured Eudoraea sp.]|uniref:HYR-like domain-containing protein n=1 Tax=uncultured Eudoraea sp. TaxID=1035614 RepID=UPI00260858A6|nr:hypothetical protein [uncultured Eudoraea sp.]